MTIAKYLPISADLPLWSTDTNFTNGPDTGTPTKVAPSAGQIAEGYLPDSEPPAQWFNWFQNAISKHISPLVGAAVHNWRNHVVTAASDGEYNHANAFCSTMSAVSGGVPVLIAIANDDGKVRRIYNESAVDESAADTGFETTVLAPVAAGVFSGAVTLVKAFGVDVRKSTDFGATWASAGSIPSTIYNYCTHFFAAANAGAGRWITTISGTGLLHYSSDLSTWTAGTGSFSATDNRISSNATAAILVYNTGTTCRRSTDGITWASQTLSAGSHPWTGVTYNTVRGAWMAVANDGVGAISSSDGVSWTAIALPSGAQDVAAFGRFFVAVCTNAHSVGCSIAVTEDNGTTWTEFMIDADPAAALFERLLVFDGRLVAIGRVSGGGMRMLFSDRAAWMPVPGAE